jgi:hypothetical protein
MTTTERPVASPHAMSAGNLRLYLTAFLGTAYVIAWWLFGARPVGSAEQSVAEPMRGSSMQTPRTAWFGDLPPAERPIVELPPGWHIAAPTASPPSAMQRAVPVPVRVQQVRAGRIRARSS